MIVDVHTQTPRYRDHAPEENYAQPVLARPDQKTPRFARTWNEYLEAMDSVDRAICFNIAADPLESSPSAQTMGPTRDVNDEAAAFVRAHPEKLIGFMSVNPCEPFALEEMERCVQDLHLRGIKLAPNYQNFDPVGEVAFRVYRRAEELGLPIVFHQGTSAVRMAHLDYAHPRHIDRVAMAFPELRVVMAHLGHPWQADCFALIRKHPNVFADLSAGFYRPWSYYNALLLASEWSVLPKILFASDFPAATPQETMEGTRRVNAPVEGTSLPRVPDDQLEAIFQRDGLALLRLE